MGQLDLTKHIKWSADDDWYYGSIETVGPDGVIGLLEAKISRPWVFHTAMNLRKRLMQTAPSNVNVGAWTNLSDPQRFKRLCQHVANEQIQQQIIAKYRNKGIVPTPWFEAWTTETADRAYELVVAAQAGNESAMAQLDRIRAHAEQGEPRAAEALAKINAVAKMVCKGLPKPSILAQHMVPTPALPVRAGEDIDIEDYGDDDVRDEWDDLSEVDVSPSEEDVEMGRAEWDALSDEDISPSEEDVEMGAGKTTIRKAYKAPSKATTPSRSKSAAPSRGRIPTGGKSGGTSRSAAPTGGKSAAPSRSAAPAGKGGGMSRSIPTGKASSPIGGKRTFPGRTISSTPTSGVKEMERFTAPIRMKGTATAATSAAAVASDQAAAAAPVATPAVAAAPARIPGLLYPGDPGYPLYPGQPGYGTPMATQAFAGFPQGMPSGGGGGGGGDMGGGGGGGYEEYPDEGLENGDLDEGVEPSYGGDDPEDFEEEFPHDEKGNVIFPEEDTTAVGAEFPEEIAQSHDGDAGGAANDGDGPDEYPDEGAMPPGRG